MNSLKNLCRTNLFVLLVFAISNFLIVSLIAAQQPNVGEKRPPAKVDEKVQEDGELTLGKPIERQLNGNEAHSYKIVLATNQYLHVVVEQKGIDVVVALFAPDGEKVAEVDSPNGTKGEEPISFVAETAGNYRLEIRSLEPKAEAGHYQAKINVLRIAILEDKNCFAAQQIYAEGEKLRGERNPDSFRKAIEKYQESIQLCRVLDNRIKEVTTLIYIGNSYNLLGEKQKAIDFYNQALSISRAIEDKNGEANSLDNIAAFYNAMGEKQKSLDFYKQSLTLRRAFNDRSGEANTLLNIGAIHSFIGERKIALDFYEQALPFFQAVGNRNGEARTLLNIGVIFYALGERDKALEYNNLALPIFREIGNRNGEANTLNNIGGVYNVLGDKQKALNYYKQALTLSRATGDRRIEANTIFQIGSTYHSLGERQKALDFYNQALNLFRAVGDRRGEANSLAKIGVFYDTLGEYLKALDFYNQSLTIRIALSDRPGEASSLDSIGSVYNLLGERQKALDLYNRALILSRNISDHPGEARTLTKIGTIYYALGEKQKALDFYNESLSLQQKVGDKRVKANTLSYIGLVYKSLGDRLKAFDLYIQALTLSRSIGDRPGEVNTLAYLAYLERDRGNLIEARGRIEEALTIFESLRTDIASLELRSSYLATVKKYYDLYIDLLMQLHQKQSSAGFDGEALQASERARARSLLEILTEANADIRQGVDPELLERERSIQQLLAGKSERLSRISGDEKLKEQKAAAQKEVDDLLAQYQDIKAQIRVKSPRYAALTQPVPANLAEIQGLLDKDTVLLEYSLGEERSYLWLVTAQTLKSYELPKRSLIEDATDRLIKDITIRNKAAATNEAEFQKYRAEIKQADADYKKVSAELSQMLLGQIAGEIKGKRLLIVGDGALQYVPFAALEVQSSSNVRSPRGAKQLLIETNEIVSLPSASTLAILRREEKGRRNNNTYSKTVAVFADPVFDTDDKRVSAVKNGGAEKKQDAANGKIQNPAATDVQSSLLRSINDVGLNNRGGLRRLGWSKEEAEAISNAAGSGQATLELGFDASRERVLTGDFSDYRIVHFATHGLLNSENPELSGVVLSLVDEQGKQQNGFLRLNEIYNLNLPVEMIVLSACETGLGKKISGEGLVGLTRGFMYAGAPRVVATLWSVDDEATKELMRIFYQKMLRENLPPTTALQAAQNEIRKQERWRSPVFWAGFILQGEWQK